MSRNARNLTAFVGGVLVMLLVVFCTAKQAKAGCYKCTINLTEEVTNVTNVTETTITTGISHKDLAEGIATAIAASHQFDLGTEKWQGSISAAFEMDENIDAVSFGVGKVFGGTDALFHGSYTRQGRLDFIQLGTTFRF